MGGMWYNGNSGADVRQRPAILAHQKANVNRQNRQKERLDFSNLFFLQVCDYPPSENILPQVANIHLITCVPVGKHFASVAVQNVDSLAIHVVMIKFTTRNVYSVGFGFDFAIIVFSDYVIGVSGIHCISSFPLS
jgi:hypothetical protein